MAQREKAEPEIPVLLSVVALLQDRPGDKLTRCQVGTVVEELDGLSVLVEFSDDHGAAYGMISCPSSELMVLRYAQEPA